jgi:predicted transcriptional regulator with HTH domain
MIELSRGSGRLQRRILELLEQSPERKRSRQELDEMLVEAEGYDPSNVLRALKGLAGRRQVGFTDRRHKNGSVVSLPREVRRITDEELFELLAKTGGRR